MNRASVVKKIEKLDIAIAVLVVKKKNAMRTGIAIPPPPIPAMLARAMIRLKVIKPPISRPYIGNTSL